QLLRLEKARKVVLEADAVEVKMRKAVKSGAIPKAKGPALYDSAKAKGVITPAEFDLMKQVDAVRLDAVTVDDFSESEYQNKIP
ncbi:MAG: acyl-CoA dehydrogenase domain-containing protein, partial [Bdellovibrionales bacterium]